MAHPAKQAASAMSPHPDQIHRQSPESVQDELPDALFEIRFGHLNYGQIRRMQKDDRVDATRTPQTSASIRIVLCSVVDFVPGGVVSKSGDRSEKERGSVLSNRQSSEPFAE
jgi:hypothetical protein